MTARQAVAQDAYWKRRCDREWYFRREFDDEDYAPAYCVGYVGWAQYGDRFSEAERSLWANWERIKGDSWLSWADAMPAIRAAWKRMALLRARRARPRVHEPVGAAMRSRVSRPTRSAAAPVAIAA